LTAAEHEREDLVVHRHAWSKSYTDARVRVTAM
jgi:hypothetical protein